MRVLIACEYSGLVREAFRRLGHEALSCDLLPTEIPGNHYQGNVFDIIKEDWDLMIAFPPCTFLTYAGMGNWYDEGRAMLRIKAAEFFMKLWESPINKICIENPRGIMNKIFRTPDQVVHPYYFGDRDMKRTCLWLKNLPPLKYQLHDDLFSNRTAVDKPEPIRIEMRKKTGQIKKRYFTDAFIDGHFKSAYDKSKTFPSIANAMAEQWGGL